MKILLIAICLIALYTVLILVVETVIWRFQPPMDGGVTLIVQSEAGDPIKRTVFGYQHEGTLYVSSNHWFRSWYLAALKNPNINVLREGFTEPQPYAASAVVGEEHSTVLEGYNMGVLLRFLCGFAPSKFLRLEPTL